MLHAIYVITFLCLLHFDEALKIQIHDIQQHDETSFEMNLPFRKTSQYGEIKPFVLHEMPKDQVHLYPVRALTAWLACSRIKNRYLFPTRLESSLSYRNLCVDRQAGRSEFEIPIRVNCPKKAIR
ncbi:hypothetical protein K438DRAFT_87884 [Mycena galopus ATCC 62051]|nr:hypothetical protein K438DRAFT_87884 [Mycena galopus ATCC 62051]